MNNALGARLAMTDELPSILATQILSAMKRGSLEDLRRGLARAESVVDGSASGDNQIEERLELLGAVASGMRDSIDRRGRNATNDLDGIEVHIRLLQHLALPGMV